MGKVTLSMPLHNFPNIGKVYSTVRARDKNESHCGKVIAAGAENAHVPEMLGWERADNLSEAIAMARSFMGRNAEITMLHQPVIGLCSVTD